MSIIPREWNYLKLEGASETEVLIIDSANNFTINSIVISLSQYYYQIIDPLLNNDMNYDNDFNLFVE